MGFVNEMCCVTGDKQDFVLISDLYTAFSHYYQDHYNLCIGMDEFAKIFKSLASELGVEYKQKNKGRGYIGLYLNSSDNTF